MYDVIILGGGPGGYVAAERAAAAGLKTLLVEKEHIGGVCLNKGCIPTKTLLSAAKTYVHARESSKMGVLGADTRFDLGIAQTWKAEIVEKLKTGILFTLKKYGAETVMGTAELVSATRIRVRETGTIFETKHVIIASGSEPVIPPVPGLKDNPVVIDSTGALALDKIPERLAVIGGGVIGIEFASLFASLGSSVTVIEMLSEILPFMDSESAVTMRRAMRSIKFELGAKVEKVENGTITYLKNGETKTIEADVILVATGRKPVLEGFGLDEAGISFDRKGIIVNDALETNLKDIYAIGDCTGKSLLAHSASRMGEIAVANILGKKETMKWDSIPWAVYSLPEAAGAGLTETRAAELGYTVKKVTVPMRLSGRFCAENGFTAQGSCKVIADGKTGILLGIHLVGSYASEIIWGAVPLLDRKVTIADLANTVFPHPTVAEIIREACLELMHAAGIPHLLDTSARDNT